MSRLLVTGGTGFLGHNLVRDLSAGHEVHVGTFRTRPERPGSGTVEIDVTDPVSVAAALDTVSPSAVVHAAAISRPDECEVDAERTFLVNVTGTANIAAATRERGIRLIHFSTDLVFDGLRGCYREEDPVEGVNAYARSKIQAEHAALGAHPGCVVIRTALSYGRGPAAHPGFLDTILGNWSAGRAMTFYRDQYRSAVPAFWIATVIDSLLALPRAAGVFHVGGADRLSRYEFGLLVAEATGASPALVVAGSMPTGPAAVPRGADCTLICEKLERTIRMPAPRAAEGLARLASGGELPSLR